MDHSAFDDANQADRCPESSFERLAASGRPPVDRILLDLAGEFGPADTRSALDQLDDLARGLFGIASLSNEAAGTQLIAAVRRDGASRAHPEYHEVARRAGVRVTLFKEGRAWFVGLEEPGELLLVAPSLSEEQES